MNPDHTLAHLPLSRHAPDRVIQGLPPPFNKERNKKKKKKRKRKPLSSFQPARRSKYVPPLLVRACLVKSLD